LIQIFLAIVLFAPRIGFAAGLVTVSGVVTTADHNDRLGDQDVGLYADKERSGGRLAADRSENHTEASQPKPTGVYCLTCGNIGAEIDLLWVLAESDQTAAHPILVKLEGNGPLRKAKADDVIIYPGNSTPPPAPRASAFESNFLAAAIEREAVRVYTGSYDMEQARSGSKQSLGLLGLLVRVTEI
jgi:hypothetical protein